MKLWQRLRRSLLKITFTGAVSAVGANCAPPRAPLSPLPTGRVEIVDLTQRFLVFYDSAMAQGADSGSRWELWRRLYGFAAVPPTPFGDSLKRRLLEGAWSRYPAALPTIRKGVVGLGVSPDSVLQRVVTLLGCGDTVKVRLTIFVGGFEGNAFAFGVRDGRSNIAVPVEAGNPTLSMIHEFTHAVHRSGCAPFRTGYGQSLAELVVTEGLAMRVVQQALPGHSDAFYIVSTPDWLAEARSRRAAILTGIGAHLSDSGPNIVQRFTFGTGSTGLSREAYYAGWEIVGAMMERLGMSLHAIATTNPIDYPRLVQQAIDVAVSNP
jgi:hypothetical protein